MTSNRKSAPNEEALRRVLSPALAREAADRAITPEFKEAAEKVRKHGGLKTGQDLLGWEAFIDRTRPPTAVGDITIPDRRNPVVPVPEALVQKKLETEEALRKVTPGSDEALAIIQAAAEAGIDPGSLDIDVDAIDRILRANSDSDSPKRDPNPTLVDVPTKRVDLPTTIEAPHSAVDPDATQVGSSDLDATSVDVAVAPKPDLHDAAIEKLEEEEDAKPLAADKPPAAEKPLAVLQPHLKIQPGPPPAEVDPSDALLANAPPRMFPTRAVLVVVALLVSGAVLWWWLSQPDPVTQPPEPVAVPTSPATLQETVAPPVTAPPRETAQPIESVSTPMAKPTETSLTPPDRTARPPATATSAPPSPSGTSTFFGPGQWTF